MTTRDHLPDDGPEIVPPAELLRLRAVLRRAPSSQVKIQHVAATAMAARQRHNTPVGRFASRGARAAIAIVAGLAITSGLAGAQLLPDSAQRLLSNVSERFAPDDTDPPADPAQPGSNPTGDDAEPDRGGEGQPDAVDEPTTTTGDGAPTTTSLEDLSATTTTSRPAASTTTTVPGPVGPGSPDEPIDPGPTDPGPTDPGPTTTTTTPPTTTTTVPPTTTTTVPPTTTTTVPLTPDDLRTPRSRP